MTGPSSQHQTDRVMLPTLAKATALFVTGHLAFAALAVWLFSAA
jgi:hypothetical protein